MAKAVPHFKKNLTTNCKHKLMLKDRRYDCNLSQDSF